VLGSQRGELGSNRAYGTVGVGFAAPFVDVLTRVDEDFIILLLDAGAP
jgi:hypothetical protein